MDIKKIVKEEVKKRRKGPSSGVPKIGEFLKIFVIFVVLLTLAVSTLYFVKNKKVEEGKNQKANTINIQDGQVQDDGQNSSQNSARPTQIVKDEKKAIYIYSENQYERGGIITQSSTDEPAINIFGKNISSKAKVEIFEANVEGMLESLVYKKNKESSSQNASEDKALKINVDKLKKITEFESDIVGSDHSNRQKVALPIEGEGNWLVKVSADGVFNMTFIARYNFGVIVKEGEDKFVFWAQDFETKKRIEDVKIKGFSLLERVSEKFKEKTNHDGILEINKKEVGNSDVLIAERDGKGILIPFRMKNYNYYRFDNNYYGSYLGDIGQDRKFFIFTDRPLYRPGDKIYFKAIVREDDDANFSPVKDEFIIRIVRGWGKNEEEVARTIISSSDNGTLNGEFSLGEDLKAGECRVQIYEKVLEKNRLEKTKEEYYSWNPTSVGISVEHFRKPDSTISVDIERESIILGDDIKAVISGEYFSGQELAGEEVQYVVRATNAYSSRVYYPRYDSHRYGYRYGAEIAKGRVVLDEAGRGEVLVQTKPSKDFKNQIYSIEISRVDEAGNQNFDAKNVFVANGEFEIYQENWNSSIKVGKEQDFAFYVRSNTDFDVSDMELRAKIKFKWREEIKDSSGIRKYSRYKEREDDLGEIVMIAKNGKNAVLRLSPKKRGWYEVEISGKDKRGNEIKKSFNFYAYEKRYYWNPKKQNTNTLSLDLGQDVYEPNDNLRIRISSDISETEALISFERAKIREYHVVEIKDSFLEIERMIVDDDMPGFSVAVSSFSDKKLSSAKQDVNVLAEKKRTRVSIKPDKEIYRPGDEVELKIHTKNRDGKGLSSEVAVWAVDKALFELAGDRTGDIHNTFWYQRRSYVRTHHSLENISMNMAEKGGCFLAGTQILTKGNELRDIEELKDGDVILTRKNERDPTLVEVKIKKAHSVVVDGYFTINDRLKVTGNHLLWVNGNWKRADEVQIGDYFIDVDDKRIVIQSIEWRKEKVEVFNFEVEGEHSYFANGLWVHNGKDGGESRSVFKDAAYWNPVVRTDGDGRAKVSFIVPDNMTTWVVAGVAVNEETMVGQNTNEFKVSKDVIIRPAIPNILRDSDNVSISAVVQNFTDKKREFKIGFEFDSGDVDEAERVIEIDAGQKQKVVWKIKNAKEKEDAELKFWAIAKDNDKMSDILIKKIPVRTFGFWETDSMASSDTHSYQVQLNDKTDKSKTELELGISSTLVGTLPKAMDYLVKYPYGCVEQTTSRFVPVVIARENPDIFKDILAKKNTEAMMRKGMERLRDLQNPNGSWGWWRGGKDNYFISAYVLEYLLRAEKVGLEVDDEVLQKAKDFFKRNFNTKKSIDTEQSVFIAYGFSLFDNENAKEISYHENANIEADVLAYAILTNANNGFWDEAKAGAKKLVSMSKQSGNVLYWEGAHESRFGSRGASTALALRVLLVVHGFDEHHGKIVRGFSAERKRSYWHNTFATVQISNVLVEFAKKERVMNADLKFSVLVDGKEVEKGELSYKDQSMKIKLPVTLFGTDKSSIEVKREGDGYFYSSLDRKEFIIDREAKSKSSGIEIRRTYVNTKGPEYNLAVGDVANVTLHVSGVKSAGGGYFVIEDQLPAGLVPINIRFKNERNNKCRTSDCGYYYGGHGIEITENGAIIPGYDSRHSYSPDRVYKYKARVVSIGEFTSPPVTVSMMYQPEIYARTGSETVVTEAISKIDSSRIVSGSDSKNNNNQNNKEFSSGYKRKNNLTQRPVSANSDWRSEFRWKWHKFEYAMGLDIIPWKILTLVFGLFVLERIFPQIKIRLIEKRKNVKGKKNGDKKEKKEDKK